MVRPGGKLAMVVPEAWLTRDYARAIQYLLLRWFKIEFVVEDVHAVWFPDAQVKTALLVAERIESRGSAFSWKDEGFVHISLHAQSKTDSSLVGNLYPRSSYPENEFAEELNKLLRRESSIRSTRLQAEWMSLRHKARNLLSGCHRDKWFRTLEPQLELQDSDRNGVHVPPAIDNWLGEKATTVQLCTLESMGVQSGQGLRTGANDFFYVNAIDSNRTHATIVFSPVFRAKSISVRKSVLTPVVRRQSDLPSGYGLRARNLRGRVLTLHNDALPEDIRAWNRKRVDSGVGFQELPEVLAEFVRRAARLRIEKSNTRIPRLSAVKTNVRTPTAESRPRAWYMLPPFAMRHTPDILIPRVNSGHPRAVINLGRRACVDANFSALWLADHAQIDAFGLLALLNSAWCISAMELSGSVMGGGALKLESTHMRRLPVPRLQRSDFRRLSSLGKRLAIGGVGANRIRDQIDEVVLVRLLGKSEWKKNRIALNLLRETARARRSRRSKSTI
jgi:hypothetical protein